MQCVIISNSFVVTCSASLLAKRPGCGVNHPTPSSVEIKEREELYLWAFMACSGANVTVYVPLSGFPSGLFESSFPTISLYMFLFSHSSLNDDTVLVILNIYGQEYKF
jgi:hypothetical protein